MNRTRQAHELRRFDRVLIHRDLRGTDVATIVAVADASFAGEGLVDVSFQFSYRECARRIRVAHTTVFSFLGGFEELRHGAVEPDADPETATTTRMARQS